MRTKQRSEPGLLRETGAGAAGSALALIAGLGLDFTLALLFGASDETDALYVALRIPLGIAIFFPPTAVQVLIPAMSKWGDRDRRLLNTNTTAAALGVFALSSVIAVVGVAMASLLVVWQAPGLSPQSHALAADLARVAFCMIPLTATSQVFRAYRDSDRRHGIAAALQGSIGLTAMTILIASSTPSVRLATWAYLAGAAVQLGIAFLSARSAGFRFVSGPVLSPEMRNLGRISVSPLAGSGVQLATRLVEQLIASFLAPGSITTLVYANRLVSAVGGTLVFRPIVISFLGHMSRAHGRGDLETIRRLVRAGLEVLLIASLALTGLVAIAGRPAVAGLYSLGDMTFDQAALLGLAVAVYGLSLPGAGLQRILLGAAFARGETAIYLRNTVYGGVANVVLLLVLYPLIGREGLLFVPLAYALAQVVNVTHAGYVTRSWLGPQVWPRSQMAGPVAVVVGSAAAMQMAAWGLGNWANGGSWTMLATGVVVASLGLLALGAGLKVWAPPELRRAFQ